MLFNFFRDILLKNGSAVEAAIATLLCDGVTCMQNMGIGGGFLMTIYQRDSKNATTLIARETAPGAADENMFHGSQYASQFGKFIQIWCINIMIKFKLYYLKIEID